MNITACKSNTYFREIQFFSHYYRIWQNKYNCRSLFILIYKSVLYISTIANRFPYWTSGPNLWQEWTSCQDQDKDSVRRFCTGFQGRTCESILKHISFRSFQSAIFFILLHLRNCLFLNCLLFSICKSLKLQVKKCMNM